MLIIEAVGGISLGMSAIGFILLAARDEPLRAWMGADRSRRDEGGSKRPSNPTLANVVALEPGHKVGLAEDRRIAA
jgi:hypothetical protein